MKAVQFVSGFCTAGLAIASLAHATPAQALEFTFLFDNAFNGLPLEPPIIGTGTFSFDGHPGSGTFPLTSLPNYAFSLNINGLSFDNADMATPPQAVVAVITRAGSNWSLNFAGGETAPYFGSLDFINGTTGLSFQPSGGPLYFAVSNTLAQPDIFGTYQALAPVPVPAPLPALGVSAAFAFSRRLRKRSIRALQRHSMPVISSQPK